MLMDHDPLDPKKMTTAELINMCRKEREWAMRGAWIENLARHRSYLDELHRRQRAACTYYLTTEESTRP
jgi:hypothetical protein